MTCSDPRSGRVNRVGDLLGAAVWRPLGRICVHRTGKKWSPIAGWKTINRCGNGVPIIRVFAWLSGSNVVLNPANRRRLEQDYQGYRRSIRSTMPVGITLENQVGQAQIQLRDAGGELEKLANENKDLQRQLSIVQQEIDKAAEKLDWAQRTSAHSAAEATLRRATDLARDIFKLESLNDQREKVARLAQKSTRYQDLQNTVEQEIQHRQSYADKLYIEYEKDIRRLGEYADVYIQQAFDKLEERNLTPRAKLALGLMIIHLGDYRDNRRITAGRWLPAFRKHFKSLPD